jgi:geranylgeranylglycerol-phosphate geranylgeranyltransferase
VNPVAAEQRPRSVAVVVALGVRYFVELARGRGSAPSQPFWSFARTLLRAARPHFFVFPGATALAGAAAVAGGTVGWRVGVAVVAMALAWSVGQLLNDVLDMDADIVDAPDRPIVRGALPVPEAAAATLVLGALVTIAVAFVHPFAWCLLLAAALLLALYGPAKRVPGLGNLAHAALVAVVALVGTAAEMPEASLADVLARGSRSALVAGVIAAVYLQANYEKDRVGDARGGYRTLAHVLGLRASAFARGACAVLVLGAAYHVHLLETGFSRGLAALAVGFTLVSVAFVLRRGTERAALAGYRYAIHGTSAALLALAAPLTGVAFALLVLGGAALLVERAFASSPNP